MATINKCAKCGACTSVCPVYKVSGVETLTARGRIHLLTKFNNENITNHYKEIFSKCLLCGACYHACPRGIDTPQLVTNARQDGAKPGGLPNFKKQLIQKSLSHPSLLPAFGNTFKATGKVLPNFLPKESGLRLKFSLAKEINCDKTSGFVNSIDSSPSATQPTITYFAGCMANYLYQNIAAASVKCLGKLCHNKTVAPQNQTCCGMAAYSAGDRSEAKKLAKINIASFNRPPFAKLPIFTSCATCYAYLKSYPELLYDDLQWKDKALSFAKRVVEFSSFILENLSPSHKFAPTSDNKRIKVFYHDPCHLRFPRTDYSIITSEPRELLAMLPGIILSELPHGPHCCGQGGLFNVVHPDTAGKICSQLIENCINSNAQLAVTTCSGCLIQIQEGLARHNSKIKAVHLAALLNDFI